VLPPLKHKQRLGIGSADRPDHIAGQRPDDHDDRVAPLLAQRADQPVDRRHARDGEADLVLFGRSHARALPRGQDDRRQGCLLALVHR